MSGVNCTCQTLLVYDSYGKSFHTDVHLQINKVCKTQERKPVRLCSVQHKGSRFFESRISNCLPLIKNSLIDQKDNGNLLKRYAQKDGLMLQPQKTLISSFKLPNGTLITLLLLFYPELGLVGTKIYRLVKRVPKKLFEQFRTNTCRCTKTK